MPDMREGKMKFMKIENAPELETGCNHKWKTVSEPKPLSYFFDSEGGYYDQVCTKCKVQAQKYFDEDGEWSGRKLK